MKKVFLITVMALLTWQSAATAQERPPLAMRITFEWSVAGTILGTAVGFALWLTDPANPSNNVTRQMIEGAALGTVAGAAYGIYMLQINAQIPGGFAYEPGPLHPSRRISQDALLAGGPSGSGNLAGLGVSGGARLMVPLFNMRF